MRTGDGLKPLARNGLAAEGTREAVSIEIRQTIDLCRSQKGQAMRSNAEQIKVKFVKSWEDDGTFSFAMKVSVGTTNNSVIGLHALGRKRTIENKFIWLISVEYTGHYSKAARKERFSVEFMVM